MLTLDREHVRTHMGHRITSLTSGDNAAVLVLDSGRAIESDVVVAAHGTIPDSAWVTGDDGGVPVDDRLRALALPSSYAAGGVAVHTTGQGLPYRIDHWDAASSQGTHAARTVLHDLDGAPDPGPYVPASGFTLNLYGRSVAAYGVALPGTVERQHETDQPEGVMTSFTTASGTLAGVAGLRAGRALLPLRQQIARP